MRTRAMTSATADATPTSAPPPASPSNKRALGQPECGGSRPGRRQRRRRRIGPPSSAAVSVTASTTTSASSSTTTNGSIASSSSSLLHRLPSPALALLAPLLPTDALLAAASADRACRAALLGEVTRLRLTAAPLLQPPTVAATAGGAAASTNSTADAAGQIAGLLARCPALRRLEGPFHHQGLQQLAGQALARLPPDAPNGIEIIAGVSSSSSSSSSSPPPPAPLPALRRSRLWSLYARQQPPRQPGAAAAGASGAALLEAAAKGRLPRLTRLDLGAMGVAYLDDSPSGPTPTNPNPTAAAAAAVFAALGAGAWPALKSVVLGPGVYASAAAPVATSSSSSSSSSLSSSVSLAERVVASLGRRRVLAGEGAVAPLEELRFHRLRDYGEEEKGEERLLQPVQPLQPLRAVVLEAAPAQAHALEDEEDEEDEDNDEEDKENVVAAAATWLFSPPVSPRPAAAASPFAFFPSSPLRAATPTPAAQAAPAAAPADAGADWRVVEGALLSDHAIDPSALRCLEVTGGCARKSRRWGRAVARFLLGSISKRGGDCHSKEQQQQQQQQKLGLRELVLTPDAAFGEVAAALGQSTPVVAPALRRLCLQAPEALDGGGGGAGAGVAASSRHNKRPLPPGAVRALGGAFAQGGLASLASLTLEGACEASAVTALLAGMVAAAGSGLKGLEELELPFPLPPPYEDAVESTRLLLALAACLREGGLPCLRRLRVPVPGALLLVLFGGGGGGGNGGNGGSNKHAQQRLLARAWAAMLGALADGVRALEGVEVVLACGGAVVGSGEVCAAALEGAVGSALPGAVVTVAC
jgi:hypothetical protein